MGFCRRLRPKETTTPAPPSATTNEPNNCLNQFAPPPTTPKTRDTMKNKITPPCFALLFGAILCWATAAAAQTIGQWDFNSSNLVQSAGSTLGDLQFADGAGGATESQTVFGTTTSLGLPDINGTPAIVMKFAALTNGQGYF